MKTLWFIGSAGIRIEWEGATYHITRRGNARQEIFLDNEDRLRFIGVLEESIERYHWICHGYCFVPNH